MRLIDADEFKKQIAGMAIVNNYPADKANKMCELIDCQPTAYDVDKVVGRLESLDKILYGLKCDCPECPFRETCEDMIGTVGDGLCDAVVRKAIFQIIKSGGIESS